MKKWWNKKGLVSEYLPWILISLAVLTILMVTIFLLQEEGGTLIERVKDLFKFK